MYLTKFSRVGCTLYLRTILNESALKRQQQKFKTKQHSRLQNFNFFSICQLLTYHQMHCLQLILLMLPLTQQLDYMSKTFHKPLLLSHYPNRSAGPFQLYLGSRLKKTNITYNIILFIKSPFYMDILFYILIKFCEC